jgi:hypothetical protein
MMREHEGLTYDQIAARTGVTSGTVESLLWRARQALKREYTVLAGPEGAFAVVPFVLLLVGRTRAAGRRAAVRVLRRLVSFRAAGDTPQLAHAAMAAIAALSVVGGIAATLEAGGDHHGGSSTGNGVVTVSSVRPRAIAPSVQKPAAGSPAGSPTSPVGALPQTARAAAPVSATGPAPDSTAPTATRPLRLVSPVAVGPEAARYAQQSPVTVQAANVIIGASPATLAGYAQSAAQRISSPARSTLAHALQENLP